MGVTPDIAETSLVASSLDAATLAEIERVRASEALGANGRLRELFEFLVQRSIEDRPPKEAEIAVLVFGKADADASRDDPVARVYIHRLRKRLDDFYLRNKTTGVRLEIPKGEYRITGAEPDASEIALGADIAPPRTEPGEAAAPARKSRMAWWLAAAASVLVLGNVAAWAAFASRPVDADVALRESAIWAPLTESPRPLLVVVGDYYIFGEYQDRLFLKRLVRDFAINSKDDLVERYLNDPQAFDKYSDVALQYLPTSAAFALADMAPLFHGDRPVQVSLASDLTPDKLKTNDIVYVGLFSGMGALRDPVFAHSRFKFGDSYDVIIDNKTGQNFNSEAFLAAPSDTMYRDYGLFSSFTGPSGNRIAIIAGARDTALMGVAENLTRLKSIEELEKKAGKGDFEALFEVKGQKHVNLETRLLASAPVDSPSIWTGERPAALAFPTE